MKRLFSFLIMPILLISLTSCDSDVGCKVEEMLVNSVSNTVVKNLQCDEAPVKEDVQKIIGKMKLCAKGEAGTGSIICKTVSGLVVDAVAQVGIPTEWNCAPGTTVDKLKDAINMGCDLIKK
jgi:hypothetical protein